MLFFSLASLSACTGIALFVVNTSASLNHQSRVIRDLAYGEHKRQKLDVYLPKTADEPNPVLVFVHGGSWQYGSKNEYYFLGKAFASHGFTVVIVNYRLYPEVKFPEFVRDLARALKWTRGHIAKYRGDPQKIFLMGHSAGAYTVGLIGFDESHLRAVGGDQNWIRGMVALAGPYVFLPLKKKPIDQIFQHKGPHFRLLPAHHVDGHEPPILFLHGRDDRTVEVRQTITMAKKIREKGGFSRTIIYSHASHAAIIGRAAGILRSRKIPVVEDVSRFVKEVLQER